MIRELRTFVAVARLGSFSAAARQVSLTQAAVSAQMKSLEDALGMPLFDRTAKSVTLNANGLRVLPMAEEMLALYARMCLPETLEGYRGSLNIGAIGTVQTGVLPETLKRLKEAAPLLEARLIPGVSLDLVGQVEAGDLDLALIIEPPFPLAKEIHMERVLEEPFVLIHPPGTRFDSIAEMLECHPFIRYDSKSFGGRLVGKFLKDRKLHVDQVMELDDLDAIVRMVETGLGVAIIPFAGVWLRSASTVQVRALGEWAFTREIVLVCRYGNKALPQVDLFRRVLQQSALGYMEELSVRFAQRN
ncbi:MULTISPECIES: LysR family transcriptional regulator [Pseudomonas]|uniref:LysR family transcriptional regulator n=1 Tax=Pseudomonadaceae TaxID=135621 RepID=UPI0006849DD4|nr:MULTISPECIES: LysR family transcriptional regulator [Pseudomonas]